MACHEDQTGGIFKTDFPLRRKARKFPPLPSKRHLPETARKLGL